MGGVSLVLMSIAVTEIAHEKTVVARRVRGGLFVVS